jgi:hypothetical protein
VPQSQVPDYYPYSFALKPEEEDLRSKFHQWLPDEIIDCHAHCCLPEHVLGFDEAIMRHMMTTFPVFTLEQSYYEQQLFYPGKIVKTLRFAHAYRGINHRASNEYLVANRRSFDRVALYGIPDDVEYTIRELRSGNYTGLKMYYQYFNPPSSSIYGFFRPEILEEAQDQGIPIILHLPKLITNCRQDLEQVLIDFPRLIVVLAHFGLPHYIVPELLETYQQFVPYNNVYMDTSLIPSADVATMALRSFGSHRIMYGSDEPLNLVRSKVYNNPDLGQRLITEHKYHWVDWAEHQKYEKFAVNIVHIHWQVLEAIKIAIETLPIGEQDLARQRIFHDNARSVFNF